MQSRAFPMTDASFNSVLMSYRTHHNNRIVNTNYIHLGDSLWDIPRWNDFALGKSFVFITFPSYVLITEYGSYTNFPHYYRLCVCSPSRFAEFTYLFNEKKFFKKQPRLSSINKTNIHLLTYMFVGISSLSSRCAQFGNSHLFCILVFT